MNFDRRIDLSLVYYQRFFLKVGPFANRTVPGRYNQGSYNLEKHYYSSRLRRVEYTNESLKTRFHRPLKGKDTNSLSSLKEGSFQEVEKSYNRRGNLRFKSSNEAENFLMEG